MGAEIANVSGQVLTIKVSGTLTQPELTSMQAASAAIFGAHGRWRILVLTENFDGWERGGSWDEFGFQAEYDVQIERMAIVGERRWEDLALMFTAKGLRSFPIQYFGPTQLAAARAWIVADHP
jgi:hypothetical protein